jgi:two-component system response regulator YesN
LSGNLVCIALEIDKYSILSSDCDDGARLSITSYTVPIIDVWLEPSRAISVAIEENKVMILYQVGNLDESQIMQYIEQLFQRLNMASQPEKPITISAGVSKFETLVNLHEMVKQSLHALQHKFYKGKRSLIYYSEIEGKGSIPQYVLADEKALKQHITSLNYDAVSKMIDKEFNNIIHEQGFSPESVRMFCMDVINIFIRTLKEHSIDFDILFKDNISYFNEYTDYETIDDYKQWLLEIVAQVMNGMAEMKSVKIHSLIRRSIEHIKAHYSEDLTIDMLSAVVSKTPNYLSHLFKKEVGQTFRDYLRKVRIEEAKKLLLHSNLLSYEIAERVGFQDYKYFVQIFKKIEGCSPSEFKKENVIKPKSIHRL